jgi:uncharacterized protein (DUF433 family)
MAIETEYRHIALDKRGTPVIQGTTIKVIELVVERLAYGWSPEELHFQHPSLTLGQIHAALAYYWDHAQTLDREIEIRLKKVEKLRKQQAKSQPSRLAAKFRAAKLH